MELMVNATVRRHMKERRPVYVRWKGHWYSGEVVRCGPAYVYKVKSVENRDMYLLERSKLKLLEDSSNSDDNILKPGTDIAYYNQLTAQWEQGIVIDHDDCGYAQIRWKIPGTYDEFINWFEAADVSTTPPEMPNSRKMMKPGLFAPPESLTVNEDENDDNSSLLQPDYRKRSQFSARPKLFGRIRSKQTVPISSSVDTSLQEDDFIDPNTPIIKEYSVQHLDPRSNPPPPNFNGIPPKWLAPTPVYYPCPMYVPVPVLLPQYPPRPASISYPFFPGQLFEQVNSKGIPPHKGAFRLFRVVPKHQSRLMNRQPFSFSGRKLGAYEPKSLEVERKIEYLPPYESIVHSKFKSTRKMKDKRYGKLSSLSDSSEDELSLYSRRPASTESARSKDQMKSFRPGSGNSGKVRTRASTELTKSLMVEKKLSDLPSSSPTIKDPEPSIMAVTTPTSKQPSTEPHETLNCDVIAQNYDVIRDGDDDGVNNGQITIVSSDSGVRTDTAAYNHQHGDCSDDEKSSTKVTLTDNTALSIPAIVIDLEDPNKRHLPHDASDSEVFTSDSKVNPSNASIEQYLLGSELFSDAEYMTMFPKERKSSNGSATDLHLETLASSSSVDVLGDVTTCRSKRRLKYSASSETEMKLVSSDSGSNDESKELSQRSPEKQKFTTVLPTPVELPEESVPGTPQTQSSNDNENSLPLSPVTSSKTRMSSFLRSLSPIRLMSLKPKKKVTFTT